MLAIIQSRSLSVWGAPFVSHGRSRLPFRSSCPQPLALVHRQRLPSSLTPITVVRAENRSPGSEEANKDRQRRREDDTVIYGFAITLTAALLLAGKLSQSAFDGVDAWEGVAGLTAGDFLGAILWTVTLYFASPLQLLLVFFGRFETERPSDEVLRLLGRSLGFDVDAVDYSVPFVVQIPTLMLFGIAGLTTAVAMETFLGDPIWSISSGLGALFAAGIYEAGRPERLTAAEVKTMEAELRDFMQFAHEKLAKKGRCHETEIITAFRRYFGRYRTQETLSDARIREMVRTWHPGVERSGAGYYKNVSVLSSSNSPTTPAVSQNAKNPTF